MSLWYLSFCDLTRPKGQRLIGGTIVEAGSRAGAVERATALGINPGGEIAIAYLTVTVLPDKLLSYLDRLVPATEILNQKTTTLENKIIGGVHQNCNPVQRQ